jgi:hypothetical protein
VRDFGLRLSVSREGRKRLPEHDYEPPEKRDKYDEKEETGVDENYQDKAGNDLCWKSNKTAIGWDPVGGRKPLDWVK